MIQAAVNIIEKVDAFVDVHRHESIICFTDGATSDCEVGRGGAAAILLTLNPVGKELEVTEVLNKIVDSIEAELSAIALALEASLEYLMQLDHPNTVEQLIFTDCKPAIDCIINRSQMNIYHCVLARVTASLMSLHSMKVCVSVAWIPGHSGIHYNEQGGTQTRHQVDKRFHCIT